MHLIGHIFSFYVVIFVFVQRDRDTVRQCS